VRVLVVEDDPVSQRILTVYLDKWGYRPTVVPHGGDAWERLQQEDFPLVISDWMLPGLSGIDLARRIRNWRSPWGGIYVILLTAKSAKEDLVAAIEAGADDFIVKPFDRDELRVRLQVGARMVDWDRTVQQHATEIVSQLDAARALLRAGAEGDPAAAVRSLETSAAALDAAYHAACRLDRTLRSG